MRLLSGDGRELGLFTQCGNTVASQRRAFDLPVSAFVAGDCD